MEEDLRLFEVGVHSVGLATASVEESLDHEGVDECKHDRVGGRDRHRRAARRQGDKNARSQHEEQGGEHKEFGVHFCFTARKIYGKVYFPKKRIKAGIFPTPRP